MVLKRVGLISSRLSILQQIFTPTSNPMIESLLWILSILQQIFLARAHGERVATPMLSILQQIFYSRSSHIKQPLPQPFHSFNSIADLQCVSGPVVQGLWSAAFNSIADLLIITRLCFAGAWLLSILQQIFMCDRSILSRKSMYLSILQQIFSSINSCLTPRDILSFNSIADLLSTSPLTQPLPQKHFQFYSRSSVVLKQGLVFEIGILSILQQIFAEHTDQRSEHSEHDLFQFYSRSSLCRASPIALTLSSFNSIADLLQQLRQQSYIQLPFNSIADLRLRSIIVSALLMLSILQQIFIQSTLIGNKQLFMSFQFYSRSSVYVMFVICMLLHAFQFYSRSSVIPCG